MEKVVIVKLGGSIITDKNKPYTAKPSVIKRLGKEIKSAQKKANIKIILTHGSGSFGHTDAFKYETHLGLKGKGGLKGFSRTSFVATKINSIVTESLLDVGLPVKSISPASIIISKRRKPYKAFLGSVQNALDLGVTPVLYGDVLFDEQIGYCIFSAEKVISVILKEMHNKYEFKRIVYCVDTDGVYNEEGNTIKKINIDNFKHLSKKIGKSTSVDVTGGMLHKVKESLKLLSKYDLPTVVINGKKPRQLENAILSRKVTGTNIH